MVLLKCMLTELVKFRNVKQRYEQVEWEKVVVEIRIREHSIPLYNQALGETQSKK